MTKEWPKVRFGEVLTRHEESIELQPDTTYREITVKLWGKGVVLRGVVTGAEVAAERRYVAREGQFILSRIDARNGALGIVPSELDGAIVTNDFPVFRIAEQRLLPAYLGWLSRTGSFVEECLRASEGTTNRVRLQESKFLARDLSLPPLPEQRRVVANIEELAAQIHEARSLRQLARHDVEDVLRGASTVLLDDAGWPRVPLGEVLAESPRNGLSPRPEAGPGGRPMLRINAVSSSPTRFVDLSAVKQVQVSDEEARPFVLQHDDVFIVRYNGDINRVAKAAIYKESDSSPVVFPDKLMRLRPDRSKMLPDFLVFALSARTVRDQIESIGKTTAGNIGISGGNAKSFLIPLPPISSQGQIVVKLEALQAEVDSLKRLQVQTAGELDALLLAILDRAFKGEL